MQKAVNAIAPDTEGDDVHKIANTGTPTEEHHMYCIARKVTIPAYSQAAVLVSSCGAGIMTIKTHTYVVERRCSMSARGLMDILPGKSIYVYSANHMAKSR